MDDSEERRDGGDEQRPLDHWIRPFFEESLLWPVVFVAFAILATFGAAVVVLAVRDRNPFALAALGVLVLVSVDAVWRDLSRRRFGRASRAIVGLWVLATLVAGGAAALGVL